MTVVVKVKMAEKITVAGMETAVITTARKRKKEIRINLEINNPDHAHKVNHVHKVLPEHKASNQGNRGTNPDNKAIRSDATSKKIVNEEMDNVLIEVPDPTIHPDHKERNQPEMKNQPKNKTSLLKSLILLFIASLYTACDEQTVYHSFQSLPTEGWQRNDTLFFNVSVADSATLYNVSVEVRNRNNYPYQNLPLLIYYDSPEIPNIKRDTLELRLADNAGIWLGDGWGGLYQSTLPAGFIRIGKAGEYRFKIIHLLPDEVLPGINDVGIKLKR